MQLTNEIETYIDQHYEEAYQLLLELAQTPAPSNQEYRRAEFCKNWLQAQGAEGVFVDEALNVVFPVGCSDEKPLMVFMAHSDVVFPDTDSLPLHVSDGKIFCPGVGDDTANVVVLMMVAKYIAEKNLVPDQCGILLVINSGEEGLGNLKGSRKIMEQYGKQVQEFISLDGGVGAIVNKAVGSKRYRVEIDTEGGHSYSRFGNRNAIAYLASLIDTLYNIKVPSKGRTTCNVGTISGGTSVNTIAQHAEMLYEFRSDERESLEIMEKHFCAAIEYYRTKGIQVQVTLVGDRPCSGDVDIEREEQMAKRIAAAVKRHFGQEPVMGTASTDCNIPLSMGINALCIGCVCGTGAHTREEYVEINSLRPGLGLAFELVLQHF